MLHIQSHSVSLFIFSWFNSMKTGFKIHFKKYSKLKAVIVIFQKRQFNIVKHLDFPNIKPISACFTKDQASRSQKNYLNFPLLCQMLKYSELSLNIQI